MADDLTGRAVLVTGGSRGIGRAIALGLATRGAPVAVNYVRNDRRAEEVVTAVRDKGGTAVAIRADLSSPAGVTDLFDRAERELGQLSIVVANAADAVVKPVVECTEEDFDRIFAMNAKGVFFTLREAAHRLPDGGRIIATSTGGTRMFFSETSLYLGSKGAVEQFVRVLSRELGPRGITVNALSPGFTDTDLLPDRDREVAAGMSPFGRVGRPTSPTWRCSSPATRPAGSPARTSAPVAASSDASPARSGPQAVPHRSRRASPHPRITAVPGRIRGR